MEGFLKTIDEMRRESDMPVVIVNHQGGIIYVNKPFEALLGWRESEIVGKMLTEIIPASLHDAHNLGFSRFLLTNRPTLLNKPLNLKIVTKDGRELSAEHFIIAELHQGQWVFGGTLQSLE